MAAPTFSNPFAPLALTPEAKAQLADLGDLFVQKALTNYEQYLHKDQRTLAPGEWKLLRQHENVRVYRQRSAREREKARARRGSSGSLGLRSHPSTTSSQDPASTSDDDDDSYNLLEAPRPKPADLPVMLTVGTLAGDLMDTMYGVVNPSLDMMRIQTSYIESVDIVNAAILESLCEPTQLDPFRSLRVRWTIKGQPLHIRSLVKNRDMVYLESTGLTHLPTTDELVGYHLLHSVNFPQTPALDTSLRGNVSICALYRQHQDNVVDVYVRGFLDPTGRILRALVVKSASVVMLAVGRNIMCAQMKKLAYVMRRRHAPVLTNTTYDDRLRLRNERKRTSSTSLADAKECAICSKRLSSLGPLTFGVTSRGAQCRLCLETVCSSCRVKKRLSSITPEDGYLHQQTMTFCLLCVTAVSQANALDIARDEADQNDAALGYGRSSASCPSPTDVGEASFGDDDCDRGLRSAKPVVSGTDDALW